MTRPDQFHIKHISVFGITQFMAQESRVYSIYKSSS